ncbi:MAG TPA: PspC domain-containing protein [Bacillota bacterium]|nr:PspC domain-containing protein [Bacillota bacterium]
MQKLYRSRSDRYIAGVLGGIAAFFSLDSFLVRAGFLIAVIFSFGTCLLLYLIACIIIPNEGTVR